MKKRILAWIMTFMIVLATMPTNVLQANADTSVKTHADQISDYLFADNSTGEFSTNNKVVGSTQKTYGKNGEIKVNKVIRPYDIDADGKDDANEENLFQIDLEVETSSTIKEEDLATVIVIDISNSMDVAYGDGKTRMEAAEEAANEFIESFGQTTLSSTQREVSVVMFCKTATIASDWVDVTDNNKRAALKNSVNNLSNNMSNGTSIEGGLLLARNLLTTQSIENKNVVLLSDGGANTCVVDKSEEESYKKYYNGPSNELITYYTNEPDNAPGNEGKIINSYTGVYNNANYHFHHGGAIEAAKRIRELDADIYSIYCGDPAELMTCHDPNAKDKLDVLECDYCEAARNAFKGIGQDYTVERWLSITDPDNTERVSDNYTLVNNSSELMSAFLKIESTLTSAWVVADPIPIADQLEFVKFESDVDKAARVYESGSVLWDLTKATNFEESVIEKDNSQTTIRKYKLSYYVRLDNLCEGFAEQNVYNTNNITSLPYSITDEDGNVIDSGKAYFNIPAIKGYVSNEMISFIKKGQIEVGSDATKPLQNATFEITHSSACTCGTTLDDPNWSLTATSDNEGSFSFSKIPSGHRYEMKETIAPNDYKVSTGVYDFSVIYGEIIVNNNNLFDNNNTVVNEKVNTVTISGEKSWEDGFSNNRPTVTINLYANGVPAVDEKGNVITASVSSGTNWKYEFADLPKKDENGNDIEYTVIESPIDNYYPEYTPTEEGFNIKNIYSSSKSISGTKVWDDENNRYGTRPENITIELTAYKERNGEVTPYKEGSRTQTIDANNGWRYYFTDLPTSVRIDRERYTISYELSEVSVDGYNTTISNDQTIITNTLNTPVSAEIKGTKTLIGRDMKDGETFTFKLMKGEEEIDSATVTGAKAGETVSFELDTETFTEADEYNYTVVEVKGSEEGVEYDSTEYDVKVTVTDVDGVLEAAVQYSEDLEYENTYDPADTSVEIGGSKALEGRDINNEEFTFELKDKDKNVIQTVKNEGGEFKFDAITYDDIDGAETKDFIYYITEQSGDVGGVTYDEAAYRVTVTVTDTDHKGKLEIKNVKYEVLNEDGTYAEVNGATFTNIYEPASTDASISGTKTLIGRDMKEGEEFTFKLMRGEDVVDSETVTGAKAGTPVEFTLNTGALSKADEYNYTVVEVKGSEEGVEYDSTVYDVKVTVTDDLKGSLEADVEYVDGPVVFNNKYEAKSVEVNLNAKKEVITNGHNFDWGAGDFQFQITEVGSDVTEEPRIVSNDADGNIEIFNKKVYETPGIYQYVVREYVTNENFIGGVGYDAKEYTITVNVADPGDGELKATVTATQKDSQNVDQKVDLNEVVFINEYTPKVAKAVIEGKKSLSGKRIEDGEFTFKLQDKTGETIKTVNNIVGDFTFSGYKFEELVFDREGEYDFVIVEQNNNEAGYTYDTNTVNVTVKVTDDMGELKPEVIYDGNQLDKNGLPVFSNIYDPADASVTLGGSKILTGRDINEGEFTFVLKGEGTEDEATVNENGDFKFDAITYDDIDGAETKDFIYSITEQSGDVGGVTYDEAEYRVTVTVTDTDHKGQLEIKNVKYEVLNEDGTYAEVKGAAFTNSYVPSAEAEASISGSKTLTGRDWTEDDKFDFGLYETEKNFSVGDDAEPVKTATVTKSNKTFSFDNLTYDKEGTYYYVIKELVPDAAKDTYKLNGIKYANTEYKVKVIVTDNLKGSLEAEVEYVDGDIEFTNTYEAEPVKVSLDAKKLVEKNGNAFEWGEEDFQFQVAEVGKELSTANIVSNDANGDINILDKTYYRPGTYQYVVSEYVTEDNMIGGVGYDVAEYTITVEVTDPGNGQLTKTVTVTNKDGGSVYPDDITFTNEYNPKVAKAVIKGTKALEGKEIESGEFTFELRNEAGEVIQTVNNAVGEFVFNGYEFDELVFEHAGTYHFAVTEKDLNEDGYTYDDKAVNVTVTVTDEGGKLVSDVSYSTPLNFANTYDPEDVLVKLDGTKTLTGRDAVDGEFTFLLTGEGIEQTAVNEDGTFIFDAIKYTDIGGAETKDFTYYITEQSGALGGVTYDDAKYRVTVTVTDKDHAGKLNIADVKYEVLNEDGSYSSAKGNKVAFTNVYKPKAVAAYITGSKTMIGRDMKDGETFTFKLMKGEEEIDSATVTGAKAGETVSFELDTETFTEADEYNYTVVEVKGSEEGVEYDSTVYDVKVTVTDDLKGSLVTQVDYLDGTPAFTNEYTIDVSGSKAWEDNKDYNNRPDSITVNLLADGEEVAEQSVTEENNWRYTFDKLKVFNEDGKKIVYTVTEDAVNGYDTVITGSAADGFVITNTEKLTEVSGVKIWEDNNNQDGKRPGSITVNLTGTIEGEENPVVAKSQIVSGEDWTWTFDDLPEYIDGKEVKYSVIEDTVKGYESSVDDKGDGKFEITNSYTPEKTSISGEKIWNDKNNQDGKRSESITVYLLKNGEKVDAKVVTADDNWKYAFEGLDKYENHGTLINYTVVEEAVKDYTTTYDGNDIINSYTPEETGVTVTKIWDDANNQDGIRTDSVTVNLIANGEETDKSVVLSEENNWTATFTGLDKKSDGEDIVYAVEEEAVSGYEEPIITKVTEGSNNFTITNKYVPEVVDFTIYKTWKDKHDKYDKRPAEITVYLKADGEVVRTVKLNKAGDWTYDFTNLPKYKDGIEIVYSVDEEEVEGYISEIDGFNIINSINEDALDIAIDTGDDSNPWIYGFTSFLALCTAVGTFFVRRRKD